MERSVRMMSLKRTSMIVLKIVVVIVTIIELAASFEFADEKYPHVDRGSSEASSFPWDLSKTSLSDVPENPEIIYERTITELRVIREVAYDRYGNPVKKFISPIWKRLKNFKQYEIYTHGTKSEDDNDRRKKPLNEFDKINRDIEAVDNSKVDRNNNQKKISDKRIDSIENRLSELETGNKKKDDDDDGNDKIIFMDPDETEAISKNAFVPNPFYNDCDDTTVCKKMKNYPKNYIENIVKNMPNLIPFSGIDEVNKIETRFQDNDEGTPLCQSEESIYFYEGIRKDLNDPNSWYLVLNVENFRQGIRISRCLNSTIGCTVLNRLTQTDLPNYNTFCKQQYIYHRLFVIRNGNDTPIIESFPIPSGCCCQIIFRTESRFGENFGPTTNTLNKNNNNNNDYHNYHNYYNYHNNKINNNEKNDTLTMKKWRTRINKRNRGKNNEKL